MSHSNRHQFQALTKASKPLSGQRLARVIAKAQKDGSYHPNLTESLCISIPMLTQTEAESHITALMPHIVGMLMDAQESIIKELRIDSGCTEIADESISVAACVAYLDESARGNRVTSEYLAEWFKESYSLHAAQFIAAMMKWGDDFDSLSADQVAIIESKTNVLASMFTGFASGKYSPDIPKCKAILKFGEFLAGETDSRMDAILAKTLRIKEERERELSSDALGF